MTQRNLEIVIPPRAGHFSTLRLLASLRGQGAPKNLQCALKGIRFPSCAKVPLSLRRRAALFDRVRTRLGILQIFAFDEDVDPYYERRETVRTPDLPRGIKVMFYIGGTS